MLLTELIRLEGTVCVTGMVDGIEVLGLSCDSRRTENGDVFFCKGDGFKKEYLKEAVEKGCVCAVYSSENENEVLLAADRLIKIKVKDVRQTVALWSAHFFGYPFKQLISTAVTGTKGKTTVTGYINEVINQMPRCKSAILSELVQEGAPRLTTPEPIDLHRAAAEAKKRGCTHIVCEVSSQAVKHQRIYAVEFDIGCFTNYGCDHIGPREHKSEAEYLSCKAALFEQCKKAVINVDCAKGQGIYNAISFPKTSVSLQNTDADCSARTVNIYEKCCELSLKTKKGEYKAVTGLSGRYNAENAALAMAVAYELGADRRSVFSGIFGYRPSGRNVLLYSADGRVRVVVDYAHNKMSFEAVLREAAERGGTVTVVFGCPGDKAQCRRRQMAEMASKYADKVTVTEDDSGSEGYESIKKELTGHFEAMLSGKECRLRRETLSFIENREKAIRSALENAYLSGGRHTVLLLGKGDEKFNRCLGEDKRCTDDVTLARNVIREYDGACALKTALSEHTELKGMRILVSAAGADGVLRQLSRSLGDMRGTKTEVCVVCEEKSFEKLRRLCFNEGVAVIDAAKTELDAVFGAMKAGAVPIYAVKDRKKAVLKVTGAMKFNKAVYLEDGEGIIFKGNDTCVNVTLNGARTILGVLPSKNAEEKLSAFQNGIEEVAVVDGRLKNAFASYLCGGARCTVVKRDA